MGQIEQLGEAVRRSDADVVIAGGDFNSWPIKKDRERNDF